MMNVVFGMALSVLGFESAESPTWFDDYATAIDEVHRVDKPLFMVFDAGSSATLRAHDGVCVSEQVEATLSAYYLRMFVDTETDEGRSLAAQFGGDERLRVVIIDRSGEWQVYRKTGSQTPEQLLAALTQWRRTKITSGSSAGSGHNSLLSGTTSTTVRSCRT